MSDATTTPRKQARLEWSFEQGTPRSEPSASKNGEDDDRLATSTSSPFKKLRSTSSPQQWQAFAEELENARQQIIRDEQETVAKGARMAGRGDNKVSSQRLKLYYLFF